MARVIISSGHSSANPGSVANGLREVDVARQIAKATLKYLRINGVISLSVPPEMELLQRIDWINNTGYLARLNDMSVEIHVNDGGKSGIEAWFEGDGQNASQQLTQLILDGATSESGLPSQGAKSEYKHEIGSIAFVHETNPIGSLIECGYIDNIHDATFLKVPENLDKIGKGITKGICKFLNVEFREPTGPSIPVIKPPQKFGQDAPTHIPSANQTPAQVVQTRFQEPPQPVGTIPSQQVASFNNNTGMVGSQPPMGASNNAFQPLPSREERRKMIIANYIKILGREPTQNDINYFLNVGIKEDELVRKMIDSQEHADLVKSKQEFTKIKQEHETQKADFEQMKSAMADQSRIIEGLNYSIMQKNAALQTNNPNSFIHQTAGASAQFSVTTKGGGKPKKPNYKGSFLDKLFKAFSDLFD